MADPSMVLGIVGQVFSSAKTIITLYSDCRGAKADIAKEQNNLKRLREILKPYEVTKKGMTSVSPGQKEAEAASKHARQIISEIRTLLAKYEDKQFRWAVYGKAKRMELKQELTEAELHLVLTLVIHLALNQPNSFGKTQSSSVRDVPTLVSHEKRPANDQVSLKPTSKSRKLNQLARTTETKTQQDRTKNSSHNRGMTRMNKDTKTKPPSPPKPNLQSKIEKRQEKPKAKQKNRQHKGSKCHRCNRCGKQGAEPSSSITLNSACGHWLCDGCIRLIFLAAIATPRTDPTCCPRSGFLSFSHAARVLDPASQMTFKALWFKRELSCPSRTCKNICDYYIHGVRKQVGCQKCGQGMCSRCSGQWHDTHGCADITGGVNFVS